MLTLIFRLSHLHHDINAGQLSVSRVRACTAQDPLMAWEEMRHGATCQMCGSDRWDLTLQQRQIVLP
jgi:hypothetical protein